MESSMIIEEESQNFDWDADPLGLFSYKVLIMENTEPDIQVVEVDHDVELAMLVQERFGGDPIQTIVNNLDPATRDRCPYFRVVMSEFGSECAINFKLRAFYNQIKMSSLNPRCRRAMVIGLHALERLDSPISMPMAFCTTTINPLDYCIRDEVDLGCLKPCAQRLNPGAANICDVAGLVLPCYVPLEIQWKILGYLKSPEAAIIQDAMNDVGRKWDDFLHPMFVQREPRIPVHIARFYDAATVQSAIVGATSSRRVQSAHQTA